MASDLLASRIPGSGGWITPPPDFFSLRAPELAPALLGCLLSMESPDGTASGIIVETEAYTEDDPASHSHRGPTPRNRSMFARGGTAYVYFIYGMHSCFNVSAGPPGVGEAVLVRALEPCSGIDIMVRRRGGRSVGLADGPAKLCQALGITLEHDGLDLSRASGPGPGLLVQEGGGREGCWRVSAGGDQQGPRPSVALLRPRKPVPVQTVPVEPGVLSHGLRIALQDYGRLRYGAAAGGEH